MEKEFEALNYLYNDLRLMKCLDIGEEAKVKSAYNCLHQALTELKTIKEANPSEAMDKLEGLGFGLWNEDKSITSINGHYFKNAYDIIKQALLNAQEQDKVLEIIKEHLTFEDSGIEVVKVFINDKEETKYIIKVTSKDTGATIHIHLDTEEEFDLLKRYLNGK